ncbi:hypothetical protein O6H91_14G010800 [Diphasiastrum complanatum]|uniref:Uncharacterized protein n=1 Tax=Diphasiastrum complanatum TaxID=34168 RepID=A0ACC2BLN8_DIPCM|nr:hypothetical protein O6H91_14G010800 [Diphasiastrum complanatum]
MKIKCVPLGAGQDVGKSCVIVTLGGKMIMFDCGMHMGYQDDRRYPDFYRISKIGDFTQAIDCIVVTHFHLDHVGALPYFTEVCGYEGPIYMTYPTKALAPLMLEDYRKVTVERKGEQEQFSALQIQQCMKKVTAVDLRQTVTVDNDLQLRAYYAGHVLGAAMFYVKAGDSTIVYTGDYNMTPDRHLGAAQIDRLRPDLLITESTYATTVRDSKCAREREFLKSVHKCIDDGGKILIPVFALGRAQELCILLDDYWERMNIKAPIYFSAGLTMQANVYYKLLISWTNQKVKDTYVTRNTFDFKHGMLSGGLSLEVFKHWAPSERNMIILPGYCIAGTVGHKLMSGKPTRIELDKRTQIDVRCQIHHLSFSAHTDAKGIMDLVRHVDPRHVILVHGEKPKMATLKNRIMTELKIPCFYPANHELVEVPSHCIFKVDLSNRFVMHHLIDDVNDSQNSQNLSAPMDDMLETADGSSSIRNASSYSLPPTQVRTHVEGIAVNENSLRIKILHPIEAQACLADMKHDVSFSCFQTIFVEANGHGRLVDIGEKTILHSLYLELVKWVGNAVSREEDCIIGGSFCMRLCKGSVTQNGSEGQSESEFNHGIKDRDIGDSISCNPSSSRQKIEVECNWCYEDNSLANRVMGILRTLNLKLQQCLITGSSQCKESTNYHRY